MNENELREILESLPCPFYTNDTSDEILSEIISELDIEMKDYDRQVKDGSITKDQYDFHWWSILEQLANYHKIPYYEDLEN